MKESVLSFEKQTKKETLVYLLSYCPQVVKTHPLKILRLRYIITGYRIKFSCLYIPQGHYFISTLWLWRTDKYVFIVLF